MNYDKLYTYLIFYSLIACILSLALFIIFLINLYEKTKSKKIYIQKYKNLMLKYKSYIRRKN